jgi:hypothetical protein
VRRLLATAVAVRTSLDLPERGPRLGELVSIPNGGVNFARWKIARARAWIQMRESVRRGGGLRGRKTHLDLSPPPAADCRIGHRARRYVRLRIGIVER